MEGADPGACCAGLEGACGWDGASEARARSALYACLWRPLEGRRKPGKPVSLISGLPQDAVSPPNLPVAICLSPIQPVDPSLLLTPSQGRPRVSHNK